MTDAPGQLFLQTVDDRVGIEAQAVQLRRKPLYVVGMAVADADDGVSAIEVEILLPFIVPHLASLTFHDVDIEEGINVE